MKQIAQRMHSLGTESAFEVLAKAKKLEAQGKHVIHLEIGQPDFPTPPHICAAAFQAMQQGYTGYGPADGLIELRTAISEHISTTRQIEVGSDAHTFVGAGDIARAFAGDAGVAGQRGFGRGRAHGAGL
ncbi:MAG: aminotransferase class I/II-fold pyridoxal phosphate-dependent enzyme [Pseudanabaena sp. CRU_2_10]|nr:aminotransferase class I/II-fold pyridoxal phosphate-dependent enzyme [Pseudanabaena sp. CRU_2_10]